MKKLLVVDGNSILNRAFYGIRPLQTKDGLWTHAIYGMVNIIHRQLETYSPDYFAVAFDLREKTFRHLFSEAYKANRHGMPEELACQIEPAKECLRAMGAAVLSLAGYEADDILGTLSAMAEREGVATFLSTGDRDSLQLISPLTSVVLATNTEPILFNEAKFFEKYGVRPTQFIDVKALMGDSSDNIPGVPGIGEKTALKLIAEFGDLDAIYENQEQKPIAAGVAAKLEAGKQSAYDSRFLATIKRDVPLDLTLDDLAYHGPDESALTALFTRLEFTKLIEKLNLHADVAPTRREVAQKEIDAASLTLAKGKKYAIAFDFEADTAAIAADEVLLIRGIASLADVLDGDVPLITYDAKSAFHALAPMGIAFSACTDDVMLMGYLSAVADTDFSLEKLMSRTLGEQAETLAEKASGIARLYDEYAATLAQTGQDTLYREIEMPLCRLLFEMEHDGFSVNVPALRAFSQTLGERQNEYAERIYLQAGTEFNINSPKQLGAVLFETMGLPHAKKTKSGYSTNAETLEKLRSYSPIIDDILDFRQVGKLKSTYADGLAAAADENGRVHTRFKQALTATGRLSSTEPNLQNIPVRTELGREFRKFFVAQNDDWMLIDADYSQIELRLLAAISGDEAMQDAFRSGYDIHTATAMKVFGVPRDAVTIELRKKAKAINFGIVYGMGEFSLASDLHISRADARAYIDGYLGAYPKVKEYLSRVVEEAKRDGYVKTLFGRRRYIPELSSGKRMEVAFGERVAMNSPIQGTAADIIKLAMVNTAKKLRESGLRARIILQVHDELILESHRSCADAVCALLKEEMEHAVSLAVPLTVELSTGATWFEAK